MFLSKFSGLFGQLFLISQKLGNCKSPSFIYMYLSLNSVDIKSNTDCILSVSWALSVPCKLNKKQNAYFYFNKLSLFIVK